MAPESSSLSDRIGTARMQRTRARTHIGFMGLFGQPVLRRIASLEAFGCRPFTRFRSLSMRTEFKLLRPRLVPLSPGEEREAVALLAELLLNAAGKRRAGVCGGAFGSASGGATGSVAPFPETPAKPRRAA
jgi:hypothetical protein